ncbi:MAG: hypothetical protein CL946_01920 [Ectothiorhodospiraceae bacterium]|nr:hypothetical protein [Ectothiorhodospiraceae bacterium]
MYLNSRSEHAETTEVRSDQMLKACPDLIAPDAQRRENGINPAKAGIPRIRSAPGSAEPSGLCSSARATRESVIRQ